MKGTGTSIDPYLVETAEDLNSLRGKASHAKLMNDISLKDFSSGKGWEPIRTIRNFDGNFKVIKDLYINRPDEDNVGLFTDLNVVIRLGVENATVIGRNYVGTILGKPYGYNDRYSYNYVKDATVRGSYYVGGMYGQLKNCVSQINYSNAKVSGDRYAGGIAGASDYYGSLGGSYFFGTVAGNGYVNPIGTKDSTITSATQCYYDKDKCNIISTDGSIGKTTNEMKNADTYEGWNFSSIYEIDPKKNDGYPIIRGFSYNSSLKKNVYLIKQNNQYYSIKPEYYNAISKKFDSLVLSDVSPNQSEIENFAFDDISTLTNSITVGEETFRPIDKLDENFKVELYKV